MAEAPVVENVARAAKKTFHRTISPVMRDVEGRRKTYEEAGCGFRLVVVEPDDTQRENGEGCDAVGVDGQWSAAEGIRQCSGQEHGQQLYSIEDHGDEEGVLVACRLD